MSTVCRPDMAHAQPCGTVPDHEDECACGCTAYEEWCMEDTRLKPAFVIIDQFAYDMKIEFAPCKTHGTRIHLDGECVGCMEDRFGPLTED